MSNNGRKSIPGRNWSRSLSARVASEQSCNRCQRGYLSCNACDLAGKTTCSGCGGQGSKTCGTFGGTGVYLHGSNYSAHIGEANRSSFIMSNPSARCSGCGGSRRSSCYSCNSTGRTVCTACGGTKRVSCSSCAATGWLHNITSARLTSSIISETTFDVADEEIKEAVDKLIQKPSLSKILVSQPMSVQYQTMSIRATQTATVTIRQHIVKRGRINIASVNETNGNGTRSEKFSSCFHL